ncbi:MAG: GTP 3',8-cyclase MoaA [Opitutus sp.]|nr:GTP 3',8-cyclase MoaA [Opitutus sp.]
MLSASSSFPAPLEAAPAGSALRDQFGRTIDYLRVSLTDACNLRCVYCMPENARFLPRHQLLSDDELLRLLRLFAELGFRKVRFTGGEPTLRSSLVEIVRATAALPGVENIGLTTNGVLLSSLAEPLQRAGLHSVNISIDTLVPDRFGRITRCGRLDDVLAGVEAAGRAGLKVKINCVVCRGLNDGGDVLALARLTLAHDWQVRFIEEMPFRKSGRNEQLQPVPQAEMMAKLEREFGALQPLHGGRLEGEARVYQLSGARGSVGFISPVSNPFCGDCNRLRLTADGELRMCLLRDDEVQLRMPLRTGADDDTLRETIRGAVLHKPWGHGLPDHVHPSNRTMAQIGG